MREIKFRAWDVKVGAYVIPAHTMNIHTGQISDLPDRFLLEQFTGLHDKNGKEIYEGDVVMMDEEAVVSPNEAVVIEYDFGVPLSHPVDSRFYNTNCIHELCADHLGNGKPRHGVAGIVIGNIHENPELLNAH